MHLRTPFFCVRLWRQMLSGVFQNGRRSYTYRFFSLILEKLMSSDISGTISAILTILNATDMSMLLVFLPILMTIGKCAGEIFFYSDFELSDWDQKFRPANPAELLATLSTPSPLECSQGQ